MSELLSANTQAILLLTAPLISGPGARSGDLLSPREYRSLALQLRAAGSQPSDLLAPDFDLAVNGAPLLIERARLMRLLGRGFLLSQAVDRWHSRAIWVLSRADGEYPRRLKSRLKEDAPVVLYGCGQRESLDTGGLAVVGSRNVEDELIEYTLAIGHLAAKAGRTLVSGGARGIDRAAMRGAAEAGGKVIGVLADGLEKAALNREHRNLILDGQLTLTSTYDPSAGFNVGNAMRRNKVIYALADAALVVSSDHNKGGTWSGAVEQLDKLRLVPVYVRSTGETGNGIETLRKKGALSWPNPQDADEFNAVFRAELAQISHSPPQTQLSLHVQQHAAKPMQVRELGLAPVAPERDVPATVEDSSVAPAVELFAKVRTLLLRMLQKPRKPADVASELGVTKRQTEEWLRRLVEEGMVEKRGKRMTFVVREVDLFNGRRTDESGDGIGTTESRE